MHDDREAGGCGPGAAEIDRGGTAGARGRDVAGSAARADADRVTRRFGTLGTTKARSLIDPPLRHAVSADAADFHGLVRNADAGGAARPRGDVHRRQRLADVVALRHVAAHRAQPFERGFVLDAFGDHGESDVVREVDGRAHDDRIARVARHPLHERLVDLDLVQRQPAQIGERGITGAVIVDGKTASERMQELQILDCMSLVIKNRALGNLE